MSFWSLTTGNTGRTRILPLLLSNPSCRCRASHSPELGHFSRGKQSLEWLSGPRRTPHRLARERATGKDSIAWMRGLKLYTNRLGEPPHGPITTAAPIPVAAASHMRRPAT